MYKMKNILSILLVMMMFVFIAVPGALPVFAADTTAADTTDTAAATDTSAAADTAAAAVTTAAAKPIVISDTSNIIGIFVAVILGAGAIVLIVILAPKNTAPKKK